MALYDIVHTLHYSTEEDWPEYGQYGLEATKTYGHDVMCMKERERERKRMQVCELTVVFISSNLIILIIDHSKGQRTGRHHLWIRNIHNQKQVTKSEDQYHETTESYERRGDVNKST